MLLVISNIAFVVIFMHRTNSYKCKAIAFKVLCLQFTVKQDIKKLSFLVDFVLKMNSKVKPIPRQTSSEAQAKRKLFCT